MFGWCNLREEKIQNWLFEGVGFGESYQNWHQCVRLLPRITFKRKVEGFRGLESKQFYTVRKIFQLKLECYGHNQIVLLEKPSCIEFVVNLFLFDYHSLSFNFLQSIFSWRLRSSWCFSKVKCHTRNSDEIVQKFRTSVREKSRGRAKTQLVLTVSVREVVKPALSTIMIKPLNRSALTLLLL